MTYPPEIIRHYPRHEDATGYLASRGFSRASEGWRNGRWMAHLDREGTEIRVRVWLPFRTA